MKIYPAIDLLGGKAVRLRGGERDKMTVFSDTPHTLVADFAAAGADRVHVVDLAGAFSGVRVHRAAVERIIKASPIPVQVGGGIRDAASLAAVFAAGASFAVLGTAAVKHPAFAESACRDYPGRVIIAVDARDGVVAVEGWVERSTMNAAELGCQAARWGAAGLLYTDVSRDGTGRGVNLSATRALMAAVGPDMLVIASGGVAGLEDIRTLAAAGVPAVVVGRSLYEGRFTIAEAVAAANT